MDTKEERNNSFVCLCALCGESAPFTPSLAPINAKSRLLLGF